MLQLNAFFISSSAWVFLVLFIIVILEGVLLVWLFLRINTIQKKTALFFSGKDAANLESTILSQIKHIQKLDADMQELFDVCNKIHALAAKGLYRVGFVRFNPFKDVGGNQSFALALLDGKKTGVVLSSLYTREGTRIYAKPIYQGTALEQYPFTEEETRAIQSASAQKISPDSHQEK